MPTFPSWSRREHGYVAGVEFFCGSRDEEPALSSEVFLVDWCGFAYGWSTAVTQQINLYEERLRPRHELATARNLGVSLLVVLAMTSLFVVFTSMEASRLTEAAAASQKQLTIEQERVTTLNKKIAESRVTPALAAERDAAKRLRNAR